MRLSKSPAYIRRSTALASRAVIGPGLLILSCFAFAQDQPPESGNSPAATAAAPKAPEVFGWHDVPEGQVIPVQKSTIDQSGYRIQDTTGETIEVPFVNDDLDAMKFGKSTSGFSYFVNKGEYPVLYLAPGATIESTAAPGARWNPIPSVYPYEEPIYVKMAPDYQSYLGMGWYPNMLVTGGMWGRAPGLPYYPWTAGYGFYVDRVYYTSWTAYRSYYLHTPGYVMTKDVSGRYVRPRIRPWPKHDPHSNPASAGTGASIRPEAPANGHASLPVVTGPHTEGRAAPKAPPIAPQVQNNRPQVRNNTPPVQNNTPPMRGNTPQVQNNRPPVRGNTPPVQNNRPPVRGNTPPVRPRTPPKKPV